MKSEDIVCYMRSREGKGTLASLEKLLESDGGDIEVTILMQRFKVRVDVVDYGQVDTFIRVELVSIVAHHCALMLGAWFMFCFTLATFLICRVRIYVILESSFGRHHLLNIMRVSVNRTAAVYRRRRVRILLFSCTKAIPKHPAFIVN